MALLFAVVALLWVHWSLALLLAGVALLYVEMIYPRWNFFGRARLDVRDAGERAVTITFDDGPSIWTEQILDILCEKGVRATFFLLGKNVERFPEIARRIADEGHTIGYHAYSHTKLHKKGPAFIREEFDFTVRAFQKAGLPPSNLIRLPHGFKNFFAVREIAKRGWTLCGWGLGVWDSKKPGVDIIVERSQALREGEILLLHDGDGAKENSDRSQTVEALPQIIESLRSRGFHFVTLKPTEFGGVNLLQTPAMEEVKVISVSSNHQCRDQLNQVVQNRD